MAESLFEDMLNLPEFEITDFNQTDKEMYFHLKVKELPAYCPKCGIVMPKMIIQKSRTQEIRNLNILNKHVTLLVNAVIIAVWSVILCFLNHWLYRR